MSAEIAPLLYAEGLVSKVSVLVLNALEFL